MPRTPVSAPLRAQTRRFKKSGTPALIVVVLVLLSIILGTSLWSYTAIHHASNGAFPTFTVQYTATPHATAYPNSTAVAASTSITSAFPNIVKPYVGTIHSIRGKIATGMMLSNIQQQQGNMNGIFSGLNENGPFKGTISITGHIHFIVIVDV